MYSAAGGFSLHLDIVDGDNGGAAVLCVRGEVDAANAEALEAALIQILDANTPVIVDLSGMPFIDSYGLNAVVRVLRQRREALVALAGATPAITRMIEIRGLDRMVGVHDSVGAAIAALAAPAP